jgi:MFS family permease
MKGDARKHSALRFVLLIGVVSFFADFTYEGARSVNGPFLASLGASGALVATIAGAGELLGYGLRIVSGQQSERTGKFWPITLFGYVVQMGSVPLLALAHHWQTAAGLIILERIGKAIRNPPRDVMLSHAAQEMGYGWGFGIHEALDQFGALFGPLLVTAMLVARGDYRSAFAILLVPALIVLALLAVACLLYPQPERLEGSAQNLQAHGLPREFWLYAVGAGLVAAGFVDFSLVAFHFARAAVIAPGLVPVFYAVAMAVSGLGSLLFGKLFDRRGFSILIPLTFVTAFFAPLMFSNHGAVALLGCALWGLGMGVHESIIPAAVAGMVAPQRRASAYGIFTAIYGVSWFLGSVLIGLAYDVSVAGAASLCILLELAAIPVFMRVGARLKTLTP